MKAPQQSKYIFFDPHRQNITYCIILLEFPVVSTVVKKHHATYHVHSTISENNIMKHGQKGDLHAALQADYNSWGCVGNLKINDLFADLNLPLDNYHLTRANKISYYQGENAAELNAILLRFERTDGKNSGYGGEHISIIYDTKHHRLLGFTRMQAELDNTSPVSHQKALTTALNFMKQHAPDLIEKNMAIPEIITLSSDERVEFKLGIKLGQLNLNWIAGHDEIIKADGAEKIVHGMKVKFQLPMQNLWAWVIVDKYGQVETFERNISWDMNSMQRNTQMWLHDAWLQAQKIKL